MSGAPRCPGAGLAGDRYLLAVVLLAVLTSLATLVLIAAGARALAEPHPGGVESTVVEPFVTYGPPAGSPPAALPAPCPYAGR